MPIDRLQRRLVTMHRASTLILVGLPVALVIIMLGLGLGLTVEDFRRVGRYPKAARDRASVCQLLILPQRLFRLVLLRSGAGAARLAVVGCCCSRRRPAAAPRPTCTATCSAGTSRSTWH
ncbi:hypothetical protein GCM10020218_065020 [Dactylosporangium vinaceum]